MSNNEWPEDAEEEWDALIERIEQHGLPKHKLLAFLDKLIGAAEIAARGTRNTEHNKQMLAALQRTRASVERADDGELVRIAFGTMLH